MPNRVWILLPLLVFTWPRILHGLTLLPQENFDVEQFVGRWYEGGVVSDCPHYTRNKKASPGVVALDLKRSHHGNLTVTSAISRNGSCQQTSVQYASTETAGKFFYHVARLGVDVAAYVVHTDYDEYAMMGLLSTERTSQNKTTILKLYTRSLDVRLAVLEDFKALVQKHGMRDDSIIFNENRILNTCI
ncbi:protein AMBP-like [Dunckerocampus dactyliophorus]|uniref:protein AMBP-like n=1 Tax=Dunckerocampus dactyliophorus TaxID=161453 RepID=UPI002404EC7F|nr:protein AMBP-like [Dunckerocampus dactyliophorus]